MHGITYLMIQQRIAHLHHAFYLFWKRKQLINGWFGGTYTVYTQLFQRGSNVHETFQNEYNMCQIQILLFTKYYNYPNCLITK